MELRKLLESRTARALDEDADGRILVASDLTGTFQLYELADDLRQLTDFSEPISGAFVPRRRAAVVAMDAGGNERHQLYLMDLDDPPGADIGRLQPLTSSPEHVHGLLGVSRDGSRIAFSSNRRNGVDFDVHLLDLESGATTTVYAGGGWAQEATGFSPSGRYLSFLLPGPLPLDFDLMLADLTTGELIVPLPHAGEAAVVSGPAWAGDNGFFASSSVGRDLTAIVWHDLGSEAAETVIEAEHDLDCVASPDGAALLVVANANGASEAELYRVVTGPVGTQLESEGPVALPGRGVLAGSLVTPPPLVAPGGAHVTYSYSSPVVPGDVWRSRRTGDEPQRLTRSPGPDAASDELAEPTAELVTSFDGEQVPVFVYRPRSSTEPGTPLPVVVIIHGGPEGQSVLTFSPVAQGLVDRGFAVVIPNVRGSTGYGKRYASLDDTTRRLDSVADLAAVHDWLPAAGLDPERAALFGGSYGGYMVLAGVAFQPDLWAAGVDIVGISDLVTFLENTSAYRRGHREREYGSLATDREFLEKASPLRQADSIQAPLFVIHGANDPRVPVSEARQLVDSLRRRGVPHELVVFEDEGHGLAKLANRLTAYPAAVDFLAQHVLSR